MCGAMGYVCDRSLCVQGRSGANTPVSQTTCAIQNWLSQIKHNPDVEDENDFEIVDHNMSKGM